MTISLDMDPAPERKPGDFKRSRTGTPYVASATETVKTGERKGDPKWETRARTSSYGHQIEDGYQLTKWVQREIMAGLGTDPTLLDRLTRLDRGDADWKREADGIIAAAKQAAQTSLSADRGTHVHLLTECADRGEPWAQHHAAGLALGLPIEVQDNLVQAWRDMHARHGLEILAIEETVVHDYYLTAGTLDRIERLTVDLNFIVAGELITIPAGTVVVVDEKTGSMKIDVKQGHVRYWHGYGVQVAIYAGSTPYDCDTDTRTEWPWEVCQEWALIAHLPVEAALEGDAHCTLVLVDLAKGRAAADLCKAAKSWEKSTDVFGLLHTPISVPASPPLPTGEAPPAPTASTASTAPDPKPAEGGAPGQETEAPSGAHENGGSNPPLGGKPEDVPGIDAGQRAAGAGAPTMEIAPPIQRLANLTPEGRTMLKARWPFTMAAKDLPPDDLPRLAALLDDIARDLGEPFTETEQALEPPPSRHPAPPPERAEPETWTPPDDGGPCDAAAAAVLRASAGKLPVPVQAAIQAWSGQARNGGRPFRTGDTDTVRWFELCRATTATAILYDRDTDEDFVRHILAACMASEMPLMPTVPVGVVLGSLTIDEALRVRDACDKAYDGALTLAYDEAGPPRLVA